MVSTETLMSGIDEVGVKADVAVSEAVGINVGGSGVNVEVDVASKVWGNVACGTFCVSPAITVSATAVLTTFISGVKISVAEQG